MKKKMKWVAYIAFCALVGFTIAELAERHVEQQIQDAIDKHAESTPEPPEYVETRVDTPTDPTLLLDWASEIPQNANKPSMEARILNILHHEQKRWDSPMRFNNLRNEAVEDREGYADFWRALQILHREGKVVRVSPPTWDTYSTWRLPKEED